MVNETDVRLDDGRTLHVYDTDGDPDRLAVVWHHGTPNIGSPPEPLFATADRLSLRWVSFDRPRYGGSTPHPGRTMATVAADTAQVADALGIDRFAVVGHSGGGSHALACAALLPDRFVAAVGIAALAPYGAAGLDWFAGMAPAGVAALRAAVAGRDARARHAESGDDLDMGFTAADHAALDGAWSWLGSVVRPALAAGPGGQIDDDLAYVTPWGADPARITAPVLLLHGGEDAVAPIAHGEWLARHCPTATLRRSPHDSHLSILTRGDEALEWLAAQR